MPKSARDRLARLLAGSTPVSTDSAMLRMPSDVIELAVTGLGPITGPIRAVEAKRLIGVARPAQFGRREETISDASVRDTWEIDPDQVHLGGPGWQAGLDTALEHLGDELGVPAGSRFTAELHSLLVYGKGQFFRPHQDSEKQEGMVATLVVMLPSVHTGGELVVDDAGRQKLYTGSRDDLVLVAFYADRRHEVRPVRSGHRVTLTFNLSLTGARGTSADGPVEEVAARLTEHFTTRITSRFGGRDLGEPTRLAVLLDHEYTQVGLAGGRLKGMDAERVATLRMAADRAECRTVLALAEVKQTWDVLPGEAWWHQDRSDEPDEPYGPPDEHGGSEHDYELNELIDDEVTLGWWVGPDGSGAETLRLPLGDHEVCAVTPSRSLTPYETEYEGYMGNYGNTLDLWYRRAAVVVWPTQKDFAARAEAGSTWALRALLDRIEAGDLDGARADAASMEPFWRHLDPGLLGPALRVAVGLRDANAARVVAGPFRMEMLTAEEAPQLAALARAYGDPWLLDLIGSWASPNRLTGGDDLGWITGSLLPLCRALSAHQADPVAAGCVDQVWRRMAGRIDTSLGNQHPKRRRANLAELGAPLAQVLDAAPDHLGASIAETLRAQSDDVVDVMVPALRAHRLAATPAVIAIAEDCRSRLTRLVDRRPRAEGDWSIAWTGCGCDVCERLATFLTARSERTREWPLATPGRQHVHQQIDSADLPVRHETRRQGRPYSLILAKTEDLFRREEEARHRARAVLDWLEPALGGGDLSPRPK